MKEGMDSSVVKNYKGYQVEIVVEDGCITTGKIYDGNTGDLIDFVEMSDEIEWTVGNTRKVAEALKKHIDENIIAVGVGA